MASGSQTLSILDVENDSRTVDDDARQALKPISRSNKAIAAISSAAVTSLLMTPFDVVKTRMQTQAAPDPLFVNMNNTTNGGGIACCQSTKVVNEAGALCKFDPQKERITSSSSSRSSTSTNAASTSSQPYTSSKRSRPRVAPQPSAQSTFYANQQMSGAACIYPDEKVAARELRQIQNNNRLSGLWDGVVKVGRAEGVRGLWRGLTPTLIMTIPSQLTYMTAYDVFRSAILSMEAVPSASTSTSPSLSNVSLQTVLAPLCAGAMARSVSATLVTPIELVRTRLQASTSTSHGFVALMSNLRHEVGAHGPKVLFRGLVPTLYRDVPFSAVYFTGYESMKRILTGAGFGERRRQDDSASSNGVQRKDFAVTFISGATSGSFAAVITQPFDVIKTQLQASAVQRQTSSSAAAGRAPPSTTTWQAWRAIVTGPEGVKGLFRGLSPRVAKVAPACGVMISSFELIARWLDDLELKS